MTGIFGHCGRNIFAFTGWTICFCIYSWTAMAQQTSPTPILLKPICPVAIIAGCSYLQPSLDPTRLFLSDLHTNND
ncbi:hypothetical protein K457DRAFT_1707428 [Linnemannia elongata AG-77]|uniref:Uncharacterized protein n=1 Tax=Linnemannia elongata AG-77 TaxID=1314771 RepID=A0A197KBW5_9FUNG|nr:hypothetical protein K457DRAFT_1707428 [Linnemannia elongata AG-77]